MGRSPNCTRKVGRGMAARRVSGLSFAEPHGQFVLHDADDGVGRSRHEEGLAHGVLIAEEFRGDDITQENDPAPLLLVSPRYKPSSLDGSDVAQGAEGGIHAANVYDSRRPFVVQEDASPAYPPAEENTLVQTRFDGRQVLGPRPDGTALGPALPVLGRPPLPDHGERLSPVLELPLGLNTGAFPEGHEKHHGQGPPGNREHGEKSPLPLVQERSRQEVEDQAGAHGSLHGGIGGLANLANCWKDKVANAIPRILPLLTFHNPHSTFHIWFHSFMAKTGSIRLARLAGPYPAARPMSPRTTTMRR